MKDQVAESDLSLPHAVSVEQLVQSLATDLETGLRSEEIADRQQKWGINQVKSQKPKSVLLLILHQFTSPITYLSLAAAALSFFLGEWLDGSAILIVTVINAAIGFFMEYNAEKSMESLRKMALVPAKVMRSGRLQEISSEHLVPGDILFLEAGDMVSADARLFLCVQLEVNESALTGESLPTPKQPANLPAEQPLAERSNMAYKGSFVTKGNARALVTGTGMQTELGQIASMVQQAEQAATPLEKKLETFSHKLIKITLALCVLVMVAGLLQDRPWMESLATAIALAVAAIPEGLSIVVTLALAQGMLRMTRHNVIVKKLSAVETLGGTNVICTDKTGTLTKNKIEVDSILMPGAQATVKVDALHASLQFLSSPNQLQNSLNFQHLLHCCALCNTASYHILNGEEKEIGDPVEVGLLKLVYAAGQDADSLRRTFPKVAEESFTSETKIMGTLHQQEGKGIIYAKGALEELLARCTYQLLDGQLVLLTSSDRESWQEKEEQVANEGLKILAFAYKETSNTKDLFMENLVFLGLAGLLDPPREDVKQALEECRSAGISVKMITGDHPATARNIAGRVGIVAPGQAVQVVLGAQMPDYARLTDWQKKDWLSASIFARVSPKQKLDLVSLLQENQLVVGMTGDGVNDAPALKKADIGIAMGIRGTQVAQEAADMILQDDAFPSIVVALWQGRIIFDNIRKFVVFMLSCNLSELLVVTLVSLLGWSFQLLPIQILFINLITDVLPALALGASPGHPAIMQQQPRALGEPILQNSHWVALVVYAVVIAGCVLGAVFLSLWLVGRGQIPAEGYANNILFLTLILCQLWHVFNMGNTKGNFFKNEVFTNAYIWYALLLCFAVLGAVYLVPTVAQALALLPVSLPQVAVMGGFSLLSFFLIYLVRKLHIIL
ncbi:HAD-IC family P-type ATPase [Nibribacter ruber]|uniref:HAD-IC family P-type ATPase n=1 Tax=Nibribacter ruber TaxID=2698458 RepID=A0A6P1NUM1_9BACT|nr:cation-translocating P-type ATPase [Nibribacter ruber]QHL86024.1 HAD-IC family P-type ATPase [Nibribacter ruber]